MTNGLRPTHVSAAAVLLGGLLVVAMPHYGFSVLRLVIATIAVATGVHALAVHVPAAGWISPLRWMSPFSRDATPTRPAHRSREMDLIRWKLEGRRQRLGKSAALPPATLRALKPLISSALDLDGGDPSHAVHVRSRVSPLTYAVLNSEPLERPTWWRTIRPNRRAVIGIVDRILDDLDQLHGRASHAPPTSDPQRVPKT